MFIICIEEAKKQEEMYMVDMKPYDIGRITSQGSYHNHLVLRTASDTKFEVMNLSKQEEGSCWTSRTDLRVKLLPSGTMITIKIKGEVGDE